MIYPFDFFLYDTSKTDYMQSTSYPHGSLDGLYGISNENVDWIAYLYEMIQERSDVDSEHIIALGISYGGGMLLKASLDDRMVNSPPKSIYLYGAGCNA